MKKVVFLLLIATAISNCLSVQVVKERKILDMAGREISIPYEVEKVVVLNSETMSLMRALGVNAKILGATHHAFENPIIPKIYNMSEIIDVGPGGKPNVEAIISLKPDLVFAYYCGEKTRHGYEIPVEDLKRLESAGLPVVGICIAVTRPADVEEYNKHIRLIGEIFGREKEAEELISHLKEIRERLYYLINTIPEEKRVKVVYSYSEQNRIAGNSTITHTIIEIAGGINIGKNISQPYATVNPEFIVESNPDVWIIWRSARYGENEILSSHVFSKVEAVKGGRVYKEPRVFFSTWEPIIAHMLIFWHAKNYYPELPIDYEAIADQIFEKYYGLKFSEVSK